MITCNVCGHLNDPSRMTCEECGSDLSDSPDLIGFDDDEDDLNYDNTDDLILFEENEDDSSDDLNYDESEDIGYYDDDYYD